MSKIIALILSILMLFGSTVTLLSCSEEPLPPVTEDGGDGNTPDKDGTQSEDEGNEHIKVPEYVYVPSPLSTTFARSIFM